jgi:hypothetical protein
VVEVIIGVRTFAVSRSVVVPSIPVNATPQQVMSSLAGVFAGVSELIGLSAIVTLVFYPIAYGSAVKMASQDIEEGRADLAASVRFVVSRLVWLWVVGIVVGIIVFLGFIALIVPGIILSIMFSLVLPIIIIERSGFQSLRRSRELVSHRWLKSLVLFIIFGIIIGIASAIAGLISAPFGIAKSVVSSIISAFYLPLIPIALTVYYYSNVARMSPPSPIPPPMAPPGTAAAQEGMKFCPNCGTQLVSGAMFCQNCGTKQSV